MYKNDILKVKMMEIITKNDNDDDDDNKWRWRWQISSFITIDDDDDDAKRHWNSYVVQMTIWPLPLMMPLLAIDPYKPNLRWVKKQNKSCEMD